MRIGWLLLLFPSFAFAVMGCPTGVPLGNVTMATRLPVCLKFEGSELGGCLANCKGVCIELPLANTVGPVETTGSACSLSDNGSGDGDSDGSGKTPGEGSSGTKPIDGWFDFQPVVGDATGTSVSGAVAKLNKNLGLAFRQLMDGTKQNSNNINSITHSAESFSRDMKTSLYHLDRMSNDVFQIKNNGAEIMGRINTSNELLQLINLNMLSLASAASGAGSTGGNPSSSSPELVAIRGDVATLRGMTQSMLSTVGSISGNTSSMDSNLRSIPSKVSSIDSTLQSMQSSNSSQLGNMQGSLSAIKSMTQQALQSGWGGSGGGGGNFDIDYSQMPGSYSNPLSVEPASYSSKTCEGGANCFFDVATVQTKLDEANKSLMSSYKAIGEEVKQVFSFNFYGSAEPLKCLDLFTLYGKEYSVCPPSGDFWSTLASLLMFIFYFVALMVIFKR
ncbi:hypothetical protein [Aeromonas salmonicida]|uniref:hypothetical protein n=1 Tax=Aeromonas salmonicida TaxID=645 RepID=UPI0012D9A56E|nr:hypothetical protein [Aeromonas salmonicida]MUG28294.1 hypothetical protein [Aeromonas salmonicida]